MFKVWDLGCDLALTQDRDFQDVGYKGLKLGFWTLVSAFSVTFHLQHFLNPELLTLDSIPSIINLRP